MKRVWIWGTIGIVAIVAGAGTGFGWYVTRSLQPMSAAETEQRISLPPGAGTGQLAGELESKGIIRSARVFTWYLKYKQEGGRFQAGEYAMKPGLSPDEIIEHLNRGDTVKEAGIRLTVPEGFTVRQIVEKLQQQEGVDPQQFMNLVQGYKGPEGSAAAQIPADTSLRSRLEGYLFPETYEWKKGTSPQEMIETMTQELDKKLGQLPQDWKQTLARRGLSVHQMLTLASLIEREVVVEDERALVSGVIHNRLKQGMPLQIDATVQYLFDKPKERLFEKDLQIQSPYNTYLNKGLPPGPIASPSLASIKAAIYPADTKYLFYVTKKDGSKAHLFAETFEQHKKNIAESAKSAKP
ncbi:endolytic transglycosylase MltG [Paenibacillus elgii]